MTIVNIKVQVPTNGPVVAAKGSLKWEPTGRRIGADGELILPIGFRVDLVDGEVSVDVEPSTDLWAWRVTEHFTGQTSNTRYFAIPPTGPVKYTDLVPIDAATLDAALTVTLDPDNPGFYLIGV